MTKGTFYPNNKIAEYLYQKSIVLQEFILFKLLRLRHHPNNIGVHFYLPLKPYHLFTLDLYYGRINLFFPFFVSISFGKLYDRKSPEAKKGYQLYFGLKYGVEPTERYDGYDYMISTAFRKVVLEDIKRVDHMGCL